MLGKQVNNFEPGNSNQRDLKNKVATNGIYNHLKQNNKHTIAWEGAVFIDRETHYMRRKNKESLYINALNPSNTQR